MKQLRNFRYDYVELLGKICKVQKRIDEHRMGNVLFWGCGKNMEVILSCCDLSDINYKVCESLKTGSKWRGITMVKDTKELVDWADVVFVTAFYDAAAIVRDVKKKYPIANVRSIFEGEQEPLYKFSVEMSAELRDDIVSAEDYGKQNRYTPWKAKGMGEAYEKNVERNLFDLIVKDLYLRWIKKDDSVLDVGAGTGRLSIEIEKQGAVVTAVDTSEEMLSEIRKKTNRIKTIKVDEGFELPFSNNTFDVTVSLDAMIHFVNWRDFLKEHIRVTRPGGYIVYNMFNSDHLKRISAEKWLGEAYMSDCGGYGVSVSRGELEAECRNNGNIDLVEMIPHMFFKSSAYTYGILTHEEMFSFSNAYSAISGIDEIKHIIKKFENDYISKEKEDICAMNVIVFKKR